MRLQSCSSLPPSINMLTSLQLPDYGVYIYAHVSMNFDTIHAISNLVHSPFPWFFCSPFIFENCIFCFPKKNLPWLTGRDQEQINKQSQSLSVEEIGVVSLECQHFSPVTFYFRDHTTPVRSMRTKFDHSKNKMAVDPPFVFTPGYRTGPKQQQQEKTRKKLIVCGSTRKR